MPKQAASPVPGGVVTQLTVPYEVGLSAETGDKWESSGAKPMATVHVNEGADPEEVYKATYEWLKQMVNETAGEQMNAVQAHHEIAHGVTTGKQDGAPKPKADAEPTSHNADGTESVYRYEALALPDDKYQLLIYPVLGNGNEGKYPITKFTATSKQAFFDMVKPVWDDIEANGGIPSKGRVEWKAQTAEGREYKGKDGSTKHYTDLVSLEKA